MREPRIVLFIAAYWFIGCYALAWSTAYSLQAGLVGIIFGLFMLAWYFRYEDRGERAPLAIGYVLFAPPLTLMLIGAIWWLLKRLGLVR